MLFEVVKMFFVVGLRIRGFVLLMVMVSCFFWIVVMMC